jgi:hypothetical protein
MANAIRALHGELIEGPSTQPPGTRPPTTQPPPTQPPATQPPPGERVRTQWTGKLEIPGGEARPVAGRSKLPFVIAGALLAAGAAVAVVLATRSPAAPVAPPAPPIVVAPTPGPGVEPGPTPGTTPEVVEPTPPAPVPEKVTITFNLARNATLYSPEGKKLAEGGRKGKEVILELAGSTSSLEYKASFGKSKELVAITVFPDRDGTIQVSPDAGAGALHGGGRSPTVTAGTPGTPTTNPGTPTTNPGTPGTTPATNPGATPGTTPATNPGTTPATNPGATPTAPPPDDDPLAPDPVLKGFDKDKEKDKGDPAPAATP